MRTLYLSIGLLLLVCTAYSQLPLRAYNKKELRKERSNDMYNHRKYSYGLSYYRYGFHFGADTYHAVDVFFSDRIKPLNIKDVLCFEATTGFSFQPYQGYRLHWGFDYEWMTASKVHLYLGSQFALGLTTRTIATNSLSSVVVGTHSYLVPFLGIMYWPGKHDASVLNKRDATEARHFKNPTFWHLVFFKFQASASALIGNLSVKPTELFDKATALNVRQNVSSSLYLSFGLGINLPTFSHVKLAQFNQQ
jgi:hypothetical protein